MGCWKVGVVRYRGLLQAAVFLTLAAGLMAADRMPGDPVQDLREALRVPVPDPMKNLPALEYRQKNVGKRIDALKNLGDLRRALVLQEWRDEDREDAIAKVDQALRAQVVERFVKGVHAVVDRGSPAAQQAVADMLGEMGINVRGALPKTSVTQELNPDLVKLCRSPVPEVRMAAARALGKIHADPTLAAPALGDMLASDQQALRRAAAQGLLSLMESAVQTHKGRSTAAIDISRADLINTGALVAPMAARGVRDRDVEVRRLAIEALRQVAMALSELVFDARPRSDFPPADRKPTEDERAEIEDYAKQVEAERKDLKPLTRALRDRASAIAQALSDPDPEVRQKACRALEDAGNARQRLMRRAASVPPYDKKLPRNDDDIYALIRETFPVLLDRLHDAETTIRLGAISVIEMLDQDAAIAIPYLVEVLDDPSPFMRWASVRILGKTAPIDADLAAPAIARLLTVQDIDVRVTAAEVLGRYGPAARAALPALIRAVTTGDSEARIAAIQTIVAMKDAGKPAIPTLTVALNDADADVRRTAAEALGHFGADARSALATLRIKLDEEDVEVRKAAADAILAIQP